jgi:hypothetical protein
MQKKSCVVCGFFNSRKKRKLDESREVFNFLVPEDAKCKIWIRNMNLTPGDINSDSKICSNHFTDEQFSKTSQKRRRLDAKAIPTENPRVESVRACEFLFAFCNNFCFVAAAVSTSYNTLEWKKSNEKTQQADRTGELGRRRIRC